MGLGQAWVMSRGVVPVGWLPRWPRVSSLVLVILRSWTWSPMLVRCWLVLMVVAPVSVGAMTAPLPLRSWRVVASWVQWAGEPVRVGDWTWPPVPAGLAVNVQPGGRAVVSAVSRGVCGGAGG